MKSTIIQENGNLYIGVNGEKIEPAAYMSYIENNADYQGFQAAGYRLFCACVFMGESYLNECSKLRVFNPPIWKARGVYDFTPVYNSVKKIVDGSKSKPYVMLRVNLNAPFWWREENPDELTLLSDGQRSLQSIFSKKWREDTKLFLQKLCEYLQSFEYSENVIALQLAGMQTEEWMAVRTATGCLDFSAPAQTAFQAWLKEKGDTAKVSLPTQDELALRQQNDIVDKQKCHNVIKYLRCFNDGFGTAIADFCAHVKECAKGNLLVGVFYGYIGQLSCEYGHGAVSLLLNDKNIDFFASPFAYVENRHFGKDWIYHGAMDSCLAKNKLWFLEADIRTHQTTFLHLTNPELMSGEHTARYYQHPVFLGPSTIEKSLWAMLRAFAKALISKHAFWWFDMWGGWYNSPEMMSLVKRAREWYVDYLQTPTRKISELAVLIDQDASYFVSEKYYRKMSHDQLVELGFVGAPYDIYLANDLENLDKTRYKTLLQILPSRIKERVNILQNHSFKQSKNSLFSAQEITSALRKAGTHVFSEGNIVYANSRFVCLTAVKGGDITLTMPSACKLQAFTNGKIYQGQTFTFSFEQYQTELFKIL